MGKKYLATYRDGSEWSFLWFNDDEEVQDWVDNDASSYSEVEVIEMVVTKTLYRDGFRIIEW